MDYHKTRINCGSYISAQGVPTFRIKEVPELFEVSVDQILGGSEVEPWIELVDNRLVTNDTEDSDQTSYWTDQKQNGYPDGRLPAMDWRILT